MGVSIEISPASYNLLLQRAAEVKSTPEQVAEALIRLQLGNLPHIEQRLTPSGPQAYVRNTRVAVRHIAAFLQAGYSVEEIVEEALPHLPPAAIYEAIAYYYDHRTEIGAELAANTPDAVREQLQQYLSPDQLAELTGQIA